MNEKKKLKVGDKVWFQYLHSRVRSKEGQPRIEEALITKIGTKFFEVDKVLRSKFEIKTGKQVTDWLVNCKVWFSLEEYTKEEEIKELKLIVSDFFGWTGNLGKLTIEQLHQIKEIICAPSKSTTILSNG